MSNSNSNSPPQQQDRCLDEKKRTKEEWRQCIFAKVDEITHQLNEMMLVHGNIKKLTAELEMMQKESEQQLSHPVLGKEELLRLQGNVVSFEIGNFKAGNDVSFLQNCVLLRCNEECMINLDYVRDQDCSFLIGDCLSHNTYLTDLTVQISPLRDYLTQKSFQDLLLCVETRTTLRRIRVTKSQINTEDSGDTIASALLHAIGKNTNIEELDWQHYISPVALHGILVESSCHIKRLNVECDKLETYPVQEQPLLPQSIASCPSLLKLQLKSKSHDDWTVIDSILNHLADAAATQLQELVLEGNDGTDQLSSLARYIQVTTTLQYLKLQTFDFHTDMTESIVEALKHHYSLPTASIARLSMIECKWNAPSMNRLTRFMKSTKYNESCPGAVLQELELSLDGQFPAFSHAIATTLLYRPSFHSSKHPLQKGSTVMCSHTIGSGLKVLKLKHFFYTEEFFGSLQTNAKRIYLPCLHLSALTQVECTRLAACVPKLFSLHELHLDEVDRFASSHVLFLSMIRQCGKLHTVSIQDDESRAVFNDAQCDIVDAFCHRNQRLFLATLQDNHLE